MHLLTFTLLLAAYDTDGDGNIGKAELDELARDVAQQVCPDTTVTSSPG